MTCTRFTKPPTASTVELFCRAIQESGLVPPSELIADGKLHRFSTNNCDDDNAGWYVLHEDDLPAGAFGDWRTGVREIWTATRPLPLSEAEKEEHRRRIALIQSQRDAEERTRHTKCAKDAALQWEASSPIGSHPYLLVKQVQPHGLREHNGNLLVSVRDIDGALQLYKPPSRFCRLRKSSQRYARLGETV